MRHHDYSQEDSRLSGLDNANNPITRVNADVVREGLGGNLRT